MVLAVTGARARRPGVPAGFQDDTDVPRIVRLATAQGLEGDCNPDTASYFVSRMTIIPSDARDMGKWRRRLFMAIAGNAADPVAYFGLPDDRTVVMDSPEVPL